MSDIDEALKKLYYELYLAKQIRQNNTRGGRIAAIVAINGIVEFIRSVDELKSQELDVPLGMLGAALADLEAGTVSNILKPVVRSSGGRPKDPTTWSAIKGQAAATMEILMYVSSREAAAKSVAAVLESAGVELDGRIELTWATIAGWRDQIKSSHEETEAKATFNLVMQSHEELTSIFKEHLKQLKEPVKKEKFRAAVLSTLERTLRNFRD